MTIRWITHLLGTAPGSSVAGIPDVVIIDVRNFVDRAGNTPDAINEKLLSGVNALREGRRTIVCCDHGFSRSNAFAAGILALSENIPFDQSIRRVIDATGENEIRADVVSDVRQALAGHLPQQSNRCHRERWLLIGGSGALGTLIRQTVPADIELLAPAREEVDLLHGSVPLSLFAEANDITRILHFASPRVGNTNRAMGEALIMLRTVLETAGALGISIFMPSRWEVFAGYSGEVPLLTEETRPFPAGILGETKFLSEALALEYESRERVAVTILRSGLIIGDTAAPHFLRSFIRRAASGEPVITHTYENGSPKLDLIAASDWTNAFWLLARSNQTGLFHAGGGELISTLEIAEMVCSAMGPQCRTEQLSLSGRAANIMLSSTKLAEATGWAPSRSVADTLTSFIETDLKLRHTP